MVISAPRRVRPNGPQTTLPQTIHKGWAWRSTVGLGLGLPGRAEMEGMATDLEEEAASSSEEEAASSSDDDY